jgi:hypothetical protein
MLVMNSHIRSVLRNNRLLSGRLSGLLWILLSGPRVFLHLEGRRSPITLAVKFESSTEDAKVLDDPSVQRRMVTIDPKDLIGLTFLKDSEEDE